MANITSPQAVQFCDERTRLIADIIMQLHREMDQYGLDKARDWNANPDVQQAAPGDFVIDGATRDDGGPVDGRPPITKYKVDAIDTVIAGFQAVLASGSNLQYIEDVRVNGKPRF